MNVNFPDKVWARLATIAERRGVTIAELLVETAQAILDGKQPPAAVQAAPTAPAAFDPDDPAVIAKVRELYDLNRSREEIAAEFGVPYQAIRTLCEHLGLAPRRHVRPRLLDEDRFLELYRLQKTDAEIATSTGVSAETVGRARRGLHLPAHGRPGRPRKTTTNQEHAA